MNKYYLSLLCFLLLFTSVPAEENPAKKIINKSQKVIKIKSYEMINTLTIFDKKGNSRIRKIATISKNFEKEQIDKKMMRFLEPADVKGTGFLTFDYNEKDDDMWIYLPALRKTRRIVSSQKAKNFMGSEFTYSDMTQMTIENFTYNLEGEVQIDNEKCWKIEIDPINEDIIDETGFSRKIVYISKNDYVLRKAEYFDYYNEKFKIMYVHKVKEVDPENHRFQVMSMTIENLLNGRKSEMLVEKIQIRESIPDDFFTIRYLER